MALVPSQFLMSQVWSKSDHWFKRKKTKLWKIRQWKDSKKKFLHQLSDMMVSKWDEIYDIITCNKRTIIANLFFLEWTLSTS